MLVLTLVLAAAGFALLVVALITGSVIWAWGCIAACVVGAGVLLAGALIRRTGRGDSTDEPAGDVAAGTAAPDLAPAEPAQPQERRGRHEKPDFG